MDTVRPAHTSCHLCAFTASDHRLYQLGTNSERRRVSNPGCHYRVITFTYNPIMLSQLSYGADKKSYFTSYYTLTSYFRIKCVIVLWHTPSIFTGILRLKSNDKSYFASYNFLTIYFKKGCVIVLCLSFTP